MKQILPAAAMLAALAFGACDDVKPRAETAATPSATSTTMPGQSVPAGQTQGNTALTPSSPVQIPAQTPVPAQTAGLNPAHGMPGHTCAIPVGAPLSQAPAAGSAPTITTTTAPGPTVTTTPAPSSAPPISIQPAPTSAPAAGQGMGSARLNPAHGMPGHSCAIPVGQPLP